MRWQEIPGQRKATSSCAFSRDAFKPDHPVCVSCQKQTGPCALSSSDSGKVPSPAPNAVRKKKLSDQNIETTFRDKTLITTAYLYGLNRWNNQPPYMYAQERNRWQKILANTFALWPKREGMRTLVITRFVQSKRHLIKDHDNLIGGAKPIKDVLTRVGVLADDNDKILTFTVLQEVDATNPRTEITLD